MISLSSWKKLLSFIGLVFLLFLNSCSGSGIPNNPVKRPTTPSASPSSTRTVSQPDLRQIADTWNNIHTFLTFDYNISNPAAIAKQYDFVWGASLKKVKAFRAANPNIFLTYYIPFHRDNGAFSDKLLFHNLSYWKTHHPDWILYRCDRVTPAYEFGDPNIPLDFTNPALVPWQIETYAQPASTSGYDGIAADNVNLQNLFGACGVYINGKWVQRYSGQMNDPQWTADVLTWLTRMQQALHSLHHPLALIPNLSVGNPPSDSLAQILSHVDGVLDEAGFTGYGEAYLTGSDWIQAIQFIESVQQQHKPYFITNEFSSVNPVAIQWALASYLMAKEHSAALYISTIQGYGGEQKYQEDEAQVGSPIGPMYATQNVYIREYSHGLSIVNPSATDTYTVTLDAQHQYKDLYGTPVGQTLTMPPHSGVVLVFTL